MTAEQLSARRGDAWRELEVLLRRGRRALRGVEAVDLERLGRLYRAALADLAVARRDLPDHPLTQYLNGLCARAHSLVQRGEPLRPGDLAGFFGTGLPRAVRAARGHMLASLGCTLAGVVAGWAAVVVRPDLAASLVPDSLFDRMARGEVPAGVPGAPVVASFIIQNNIRVALLCFALGVLAGVPTALLLASNGWMLGTLGAAVHREGLDYRFWSYIVPHGVIELSVIVIAGGTGLMLGDALLRPGLRSRGDSLAAAANRAVSIAVGMAMLLVIAGTLEGFVSPSDLDPAVKYAIGATTAVLLYSWLLLAGRPRTARVPDAAGGLPATAA